MLGMEAVGALWIWKLDMFCSVGAADGLLAKAIIILKL